MKRRAPILGLAVAFALAAGNLNAQSPEGPPLPLVDISALDPGVRQPLEAAAAALAALRAAPDPPPRDLAQAYGRLGLLYTVADLRPAAAAALENAARLDPSEFRWPYALGIVRRSDGAAPVARSHWEKALELAPAYAPLHVRLGDVLYDQGETEEAGGRYRQALLLDPDLAAAEVGLGRVAYDRGDDAAAATHFERALALQPAATTVHHQLGLAYRALGRRDEALRELAANRGGRLRIPDPVLDEAALQLDSSQMHFSTGVDLLRRNEPRRALEAFERALAGRPEDPYLAYNSALAHLALGDEVEAERWLRRALDLDPDFRNAHSNLGELLAADGRVAEAAEHFRRGHEIDPDDVSTHVAWAKALAALGERERALTELEAVLARAPESGEALLNRGIVEAQLGREAAAEASFRAGAAAGSAAASAELGLLRERQGRLAEAEAAYRAALAVEPGQPEAGERLGGLLGRAGRFSEAAAAFGAVVASAPDRAATRLGQALALLLAEDCAAARRVLEEGLGRDPENLAVAHLLARVLAASPDPAVRDGERALEIAERVLRRESTVEHAETLAMALAEVGRSAQAITWQQQVMARLDPVAQPERVAAARARLESYQRGEPVRSPWRDPS